MDVSARTFGEEVIERSHELPVVVDFWAAWCGPCRTLGPILESEAEQRRGEFVLAKVDVDADQELAAQFRVQGIPAVKAFRNGEVVAEFVGVRSPAMVAAFLDELTGPTAAERLVAELTVVGELPEVVAAVERNDHEQAFELLLAAILAAEGKERERLVSLTVGLFGDLGPEHPTTVRYRRRLAASLY